MSKQYFFIFAKFLKDLFMYMGALPLCVCVYAHTCVHKRQKRALDLLMLVGIKN